MWRMRELLCRARGEQVYEFEELTEIAVRYERLQIADAASVVGQIDATVHFYRLEDRGAVVAGTTEAVFPRCHGSSVAQQARIWGRVGLSGGPGVGRVR